MGAAGSGETKPEAHMTEWRVAVDGDAVSAAVDRAPSGHRALFVCPHGAGGNMADRGMLRLSAAMRAAEIDVVRFNFPYRERNAGRPDPMPRLQQTIVAVAERARTEVGDRPLIIGGRSMGGRAASMLASEGFRAAGLLLLAYPLHPAGLPQRLRASHLATISMPVLCLNGTRDALCRRDLMDQVLLGLGDNWTMHWLEGADHSFHVLKSSGRTDADVFDEVTRVTVAWLDLLTRA